MSKGLVKLPYIDKYTGRYFEPGKVVEYEDARIKELAALGVVEIKGSQETKPEAKAEKAEPEKAEPEKAKPAKKTTAKKKSQG